MSKLIAVMNMTLDGFCDHTAMTGGEEIHQHYTEVLNSSDAVIYGRITYELMEYWKPFVQNPTGQRDMDEFAAAIDKISKIVYSRTLEHVDWNNTELKREVIRDEILDLKQNADKDILVGSPSLIVELANLRVVEEYQLGVHPTIVGSGLPLFKNIAEKIDLNLIESKTFGSGAIFLSYEPTLKSAQT